MPFDQATVHAARRKEQYPPAKSDAREVRRARCKACVAHRRCTLPRLTLVMRSVTRDASELLRSSSTGAGASPKPGSGTTSESAALTSRAGAGAANGAGAAQPHTSKRELFQGRRVESDDSPGWGGARAPSGTSSAATMSEGVSRETSQFTVASSASCATPSAASEVGKRGTQLAALAPERSTTRSTPRCTKRG